MAEKDFKVPVFRRAIRGYSPEHVDAFITVVQDKYYSLISENEKLRARLSSVAAEIKKRGVEEELRRHEIEEIREKAERLLSEAETRAEQLIRESEEKAKQIKDEAARIREDADIYADEAKREALEMVRERDGLLARAVEVVSSLREKLGEEYGRAISALDGYGASSGNAKEQDFTSSSEIPETENGSDSDGPETDGSVVPELSDFPEEGTAGGQADEEKVDTSEDEITIPDFSPVFEENGEEEPEETEEQGKSEAFPFAFDENDHYREDVNEPDESDEPDESGEKDADDESDEENDPFGFFSWEETDEEDEDESDEEDEDFSGAGPDFISDYPDEEQESPQDEEYPDGSDESNPETDDFSEEGTGEEPEEEEEEGSHDEEHPDEEEEKTEDFESAPGETYRDYDLDEILKGLEYMTSEKNEEAVTTSDGVPDDADIVDALKKKFGDCTDGDLPDDEKGGESADSDFYEDETHEDGESFDPNSFLRFRK